MSVWNANIIHYVAEHSLKNLSEAICPSCRCGDVHFLRLLRSQNFITTNVLIHDTVAGVKATVLGFLIIRWPTWLQACWCQMGFTFLKGERGFCSPASGAHWQSFKVDLKGHNIRLAHVKPWDDMPRLEGQGANEGPQTVGLRCAGCTGAPEVLQRWVRGSWGKRSTGKHQQNTSKELMGITLRRWHSQQPSWSATTPMHAPWTTNRRSWKPPSC